MKKVNIFFIYAPKCKHCKAMEIAVESAVENSKIPCNIKKLLYTNRVAIKMASKNGIDDLPGLIIDVKGGSFCGDDYNEKRIINAIKKVARTWTQEEKNK